jgi:hypothetical protein
MRLRLSGAENGLRSSDRALHDDGARDDDDCTRTGDFSTCTGDFCIGKPGSVGDAHGAAHHDDIASDAAREPGPRCNATAAIAAA